MSLPKKIHPKHKKSQVRELVIKTKVESEPEKTTIIRYVKEDAKQ
jgi:hypothetical protein